MPGLIEKLKISAKTIYTSSLWGNRHTMEASEELVADSMDDMKDENKRTYSILYNGLLWENGAQNVYIHFGYGPDWEDKNTHMMEKTSEGFKTIIDPSESGRIHYCFHDDEGNWDNNNGVNWSK